jgi:hypothetical protein
MQIHLKPGQKVKDLGYNETGHRVLEVVDKKTGEVVQRIEAEDSATIDVRNADGDGVVGTINEVVGPASRMNDPRQNRRV